MEIQSPEEKIRGFFLTYKQFHYKKRETIVFAGDTSLFEFYVLDGYARSFVTSSKGKELTVRVYRPGDLFPIQALFPKGLTTHYFEAMSEIDILRAPSEDFVRFITNDTEILLFITKTLLARLSSSLVRMEMTIMGSAHEKVLAALLFLLETIGEDGVNPISIQIPFSHNDIASMTGLTRETVSLEIENLKKENVIEQHGKFFVILDVKKVKEAVNLFQ